MILIHKFEIFIVFSFFLDVRVKKTAASDLNEIVNNINVKEKVKAFENVVSSESKNNASFSEPPYLPETQVRTRQGYYYLSLL